MDDQQLLREAMNALEWIEYWADSKPTYELRDKARYALDRIKDSLRAR